MLGTGTSISKDRSAVPLLEIEKQSKVFSIFEATHIIPESKQLIHVNSTYSKLIFLFLIEISRWIFKLGIDLISPFLPISRDSTLISIVDSSFAFKVINAMLCLLIGAMYILYSFLSFPLYFCSSPSETGMTFLSFPVYFK